MRLSALLPLVLLFGCAGSFEEAKVAGRGVKLGAPPPSAECISLDSGHRNWSAAAKLGGALAGGSGLAEIPYGGDKTARAALVGGVVASGAFAVFAQTEADGFAAAWAEGCTK